jgi:hypothetical protein
LTRPLPKPLSAPPWLLYGFLSLLAFSPCLFFNRSYFDNDLLAQFGPWREFLRGQLFHGRFPLWNPYSLGGQPFFADPQNMMLYPPNYLTLPFPVPLGLSLFFCLHLFWSALGMHQWLKCLRLSGTSCLVGGVFFASSNFFWLEIIHPPVLAAFAWLPWFFGSLERISREPNSRNGLAGGLAFGMLVLAGSPQVSLGAVYGGAAYLLFRILAPGGSSDPKPSRASIALCALLWVWGSLPLWGQLIPTLEFAGLSERMAARVPGAPIERFLSLNPHRLLEFLFPRFLLPAGASLAHAVQQTNRNDFLDVYGCLGPWFPLLVFFAFRGKHAKTARFMGGLALLTLLICLGSYFPVYSLLSRFLPGLFLIRVAYRYLFLYVLAGGVLAALGWETLRESSERDRRFLLQAGLAYGSCLYLVSLVHPGRNLPEVLSLVLGCIGLFWSLQTKGLRFPGPGIFAAALLFPLLGLGLSEYPTGPASNFDFKGKSAVLSEIGRSVLPRRVILDFLNIPYPLRVRGKDYLLDYPQNASCVLGLKNFGGYNPLNLACAAQIRALPMKSLVPLACLGAVVSGRDHGPVPGFRHVRVPPFFVDFPSPVPSYLLAPENLEPVPDPGQVLQKMKDPGFDPARNLLLCPPFPPTPVPSGKVKMRYRILQDGTDRQSFKVDLDRPHLVLFPEFLYPGWEARVDGRPAPLYRSDAYYRTLDLTAGSHRVEFLFRPSWLPPLEFGLPSWLALTLAGWALTRRKRKGAALA